ncbi:MAG TPA: hypothetical protein VJB98_00130, partial [Candidatus Paceibacterota bacterium]
MKKEWQEKRLTQNQERLIAAIAEAGIGLDTASLDDIVATFRSLRSAVELTPVEETTSDLEAAVNDMLANISAVAERKFGIRDIADYVERLERRIVDDKIIEQSHAKPTEQFENPELDRLYDELVLLGKHAARENTQSSQGLAWGARKILDIINSDDPLPALNEFILETPEYNGSGNGKVLRQFAERARDLLETEVEKNERSQKGEYKLKFSQEKPRKKLQDFIWK